MMKSDVYLTDNAWFAEVFTLPPAYAEPGSETMLILFERNSLHICGFTPVSSRKPAQALALISLITSATAERSVPECVFTRVMGFSSADIFCPGKHHLAFFPPFYAFPEERAHIERLLQYLRDYLEVYAGDADIPLLPDLNSAMESFSCHISTRPFYHTIVKEALHHDPA